MGYRLIPSEWVAEEEEEREREREKFIDNQECLKVGKHNALSGDTASDTHTFTHTHTHT